MNLFLFSSFVRLLVEPVAGSQDRAVQHPRSLSEVRVQRVRMKSGRGVVLTLRWTSDTWTSWMKKPLIPTWRTMVCLKLNKYKVSLNTWSEM